MWHTLKQLNDCKKVAKGNISDLSQTRNSVSKYTQTGAVNVGGRIPQKKQMPICIRYSSKALTKLPVPHDMAESALPI